MNKVEKVVDWFWSMRNHVGPKLVTGRRGIGKSSQLTIFSDRLQASGVPRSRMLFLDGESAFAHRLSSSEQMVNYIVKQCQGLDNAYVFIREGCAFTDIETTLGILSAIPRFNVFVTASSRHMITAGLGSYLQGNLAHYECLPPILNESSADIRRIWHEALLYDVHTPVRQPFNAQILNNIACHISDNTGDALSLRTIAAAISPNSTPMSPHTINSYLTALCDAYLIEKCLRYDIAEESVMNSKYRCYFVSPSMRSVLFGDAPSDEPRHARLNAAWLKLRCESDEVFSASSAPEHVDFVTRNGSNYKLWHVSETEISEVPRCSFIAG